MLTRINFDDVTSCAAAALGLKPDVASLLRTEFAGAALPVDPEILARQTVAGTIFDQQFCEGLATAVADAERRIAEGSVQDFECHDGWDEQGREITHFVPVTLLSTEAERLQRAIAPAKAMLRLIGRTRDLVEAERVLSSLR